MASDATQQQVDDPLKKSDQNKITYNIAYKDSIPADLRQEVLSGGQNYNNYNKYDPYKHFDNIERSSYNLYQEGDVKEPTTGGGLLYLDRKESGTTDKSYALQASSLDGIFGIPYQFLQSVDRRIYPTDNTSLGRKYAEKIMTHAPLLMITPCRQKFMEGFKKGDSESVLQDLITGRKLADQALDSVGRYYTTSFAYDEYYKAVKILCAEVAQFLGIADKKVSYGGKLTEIADIDWYEQKNEAFSKYFASKNSVVLYADGLVDLHDSFSNGTTQSSLASSINGYSSQAKEIMFLTGSNSRLSGLYDFVKDGVSSLSEGLQKFDFLDLTQGMLGDLANAGVNTILSGGKLIFPKIWDDSNSSRSYSFDIKLRSPDHDTVSIFFNILVPYLHLLALCLPQSLTGGSAAQNPNAYDTPFLVRAYCKGMFNINMGIITDLSARRGAESQWNNQGLPTQMDISISIEDMYSNLVMSNPHQEDGTYLSRLWDNHIDVVTNGEMIDFLSNLSGLNVAAEDYTRRMELFLQLGVRRLKWTPSQIYHYFENGISNEVRKAYDRIGRIF